MIRPIHPIRPISTLPLPPRPECVTHKRVVKLFTDAARKDHLG
jgi:hypothetical protein